MTRPTPSLAASRRLRERLRLLGIATHTADCPALPIVEHGTSIHGVLRRDLICSLGMLVVAPLPCGCKKADDSAAGSAGASTKKLRIAVVPKGTTHEFWKAVHAGGAKAAKERNHEKNWKGPL